MKDINPEGYSLIQLFRERLARDNPKGDMAYDQYTNPVPVAVELTFVAFL